MAGDRTDVDDRSSFPFDHTGDDGPADVQQSFYICVYHFLPIFEFSFVKLVQAATQSGVVDKDVDMPPFGRNSLMKFGYSVPITNIELIDINLGAESIPELRRKCFKPFFPPCDKKESVPRFGEFLRARTSNAAAGPGDKDDGMLKLCHVGFRDMVDIIVSEKKIRSPGVNVNECGAINPDD